MASFYNKFTFVPEHTYVVELYNVTATVRQTALGGGVQRLSVLAAAALGWPECETWTLARCMAILDVHKLTGDGHGRAGLGPVLDVLERALARTGDIYHTPLPELVDAARRMDTVSECVDYPFQVLDLFGERLCTFHIDQEFGDVWLDVVARAETRVAAAMGFNVADQNYSELIMDERRWRHPSVFMALDKNHKRQAVSMMRTARKHLAQIGALEIENDERDGLSLDELAAIGLASFGDDNDIDTGFTTPGRVEHYPLHGLAASFGMTASSSTSRFSTRDNVTDSPLLDDTTILVDEFGVVHISDNMDSASVSYRLNSCYEGKAKIFRGAERNESLLLSPKSCLISVVNTIYIFCLKNSLAYTLRITSYFLCKSCKA